MFVYWVMQTKRIHCKECHSFNAQYEHVRVHTIGVWFDKTAAQTEADKLNTRHNTERFFVKGYKVRDPEMFKIIALTACEHDWRPTGEEMVIAREERKRYVCIKCGCTNWTSKPLKFL